MWSAISIDYVSQQNFNIGFSTMKSETLAHLSQWQYWWWFWFSFLWTLYFLFVNKTARFRVLKMRPRLATSFRSHGKWGDFLACIVPAIWCYNILVNSSFILRLAEWQNESSLFNVRIRGRQWYWVYKFELRTIIDLLSVPKNVARNKWILNTGSGYELTDNYFFALKARAQNNTLKEYWNQYLVNLNRLNELTAYSYMDSFVFDQEAVMTVTEDTMQITKEKIEAVPTYTNFWEFDDFFNDEQIWADLWLLNRAKWKKNYRIKSTNPFRFTRRLWLKRMINKNNQWKNKSVRYYITKNFWHEDVLDYKRNFNLLNQIDFLIHAHFLKQKNELINLNNVNFEVGENSRFVKHRVFETQPILTYKTFFNSAEKFQVSDSNSLIYLGFNHEKSVEAKTLNDQYYLVLKQKRYKRKKNIPNRVRCLKNTKGKVLTQEKKVIDQPQYTVNQPISHTTKNVRKFYSLLRKNKIRYENISVQFARRLLRTKKTLVLPAQINLTLISNSYDVVHSWFLPSLGIKIDCVPGRATHHTFYCDTIGFFYGQCAEICGRYHHHMPIRICTLPFEQFLIWWYHFGLPKVLLIKPKNRYDVLYGEKTLSW